MFGSHLQFENHHKRRKRLLVIGKLENESSKTRDAVLLKINKELIQLNIPEISRNDFKATGDRGVAVAGGGTGAAIAHGIGNFNIDDYDLDDDDEDEDDFWVLR